MVGVFTKDASSAGVPVLLALGAFFGYLAASGQRLRSLRVGDNEIALDRIADAVTRSVLENPSVPSQAKEDVAAALERIQPRLPSSTRRALYDVITDQQRSDAYEESLRAALRHLFPDEYVGDLAMLDGSWATRLRRGGRELAVQMRFTKSSVIGPAEMSGLVSDAYGPLPLLLVSNASIGEWYFATLARLHPEPDKVDFVQWAGQQDNPALVAAVNRKLDQPADS